MATLTLILEYIVTNMKNMLEVTVTYSLERRSFCDTFHNIKALDQQILFYHLKIFIKQTNLQNNNILMKNVV